MNKLVTPEQFNEKYKGLSIISAKDPFTMRTTFHIVVAKKNQCSWIEIIQFDVRDLKIDGEVREKFPEFFDDLQASRPYYSAWTKNIKKSCGLNGFSLPKQLRQLFLKSENVKNACDENDPCLYPYKKPAHDFKHEADMLNVVIEICQNNGVEKIENDYDDNILCGVRFDFKTKSTSGQYYIAFHELSTGFKKLLLKYIHESYDIIL